jgi:hypothetical protein
MTIGLMRTEDFSSEVTITDGNTSGAVAHNLGYTPDPAEVHVKAKDGEDIGGDTITITTDGTNITVNAVVGPMGEDWTFEVQHVRGW